jgi:hypothetical protein
MAIQIQWRRDTAANWTSNNPTLAQGEPGFETDTGNYKIGNGSTAWTSLAYGSFTTTAIAGLFADQASGNDPSAPSSGYSSLYGKKIGGRMTAKNISPTSEIYPLQSFFGRNQIGYYMPQGNSATLPEVFGYYVPTVVGTATAANVSTTNVYGRLRRVSFVSAATAAALSSFRVAVNQILLGDGNGYGGFFKIIRFGCGDAASVSGARQFCGINTNSAAPTNVEPSTIINCIGIGHGAADTNLSIFYGGSVAQPAIALGSNFPANTLSTDAYELALFSPSNQFDTVYYEVTRLNTGNVATGSIVGDGASVILPAPTALMTYSWNYRTNNATALAVTLDIMSDYIETDY